MPLSNATKLLSMVLLAFFKVALVSAVTPNSRLLSLVPPSAQVVAGMSASSSGSQPGSFLLITHNNSVDLDDFIALTGGDPARVIQQVIMVAADGGPGTLTEHSLLAIGHFDPTLTHRPTAGASASRYRDIPVLVVQPFARERADLNDVRWLAMIDSDVTLFGTIAMVKQELDRYLNRSAADPFFVQKLAELRRDDDTWCVLARPVYSEMMRSVLELLDAKLADSLQDGDTFQFGIHYGRRVEFEYEFHTPTSTGAEAVSRSLMQSLSGPEATESSRLPASTTSGTDGVVRGAVKVSRARYDAWLTEVMARAKHRVAAAALRDPTTYGN
jgi:hypothetical protein